MKLVQARLGFARLTSKLGINLIQSIFFFSMDSIVWNCKRYDELTREELYSILRLRSEVFVVEQKMIFLDLDNKDQVARHVVGFNASGELVAYARIFEKGLAYTDYHCIGRVVVSPGHRGLGVGRHLVMRAVDYCKSHFGDNAQIKLGAQLYLKKFYESLCFVVCGDVYLDGDNVDHVPMILSRT